LAKAGSLLAGGPEKIGVDAIGAEGDIDGLG
jgi:hypothetical protein